VRPRLMGLHLDCTRNESRGKGNVRDCWQTQQIGLERKEGYRTMCCVRLKGCA
jgi:hypothetical protein